MKQPAPYDHFADIYDVWVSSAAAVTDSIRDYYVEEFVRSPGPAVELGVGNGRISIEAARRGQSVIGIDNSSEMLRITRERAREAGVAERLELIQADFREYRLEEPVPQISIPFHTIGHMLSLEDKRDCFQHAFDSLRPGGRFLFDHFVFDPAYGVAKSGVPSLRAEYVDQKTGRDMLLWVTSTYDLPAQRMRLRAITEELDDSGVVIRRKVRKIDFSWITPQQSRELLESTGFEVEALYGDYERHPFGERAHSQVWVARRPH